MVLAHLGLVFGQCQATFKNIRTSTNLDGPILARKYVVDCRFQGSHIIISKGNDLMNQHDCERLQVISV